MKKLLLLSLFFTSLVSAQPTANNQDDQNKVKALNEATVRGQHIFGGIMLAQKCLFLEPSEYDTFASKSHAIVSLLKKVLGKEEVNQMVRDAESAIQVAPYTECNEESKTLVNQSKEFVERTHAVLSAK